MVRAKGWQDKAGRSKGVAASRRRTPLDMGTKGPKDRGIPIPANANPLVHTFFHIVDDIENYQYNGLCRQAGYAMTTLSRVRTRKTTMKLDTLVDFLNVMGYELQIVNKETGDVVRKPE